MGCKSQRQIYCEKIIKYSNGIMNQAAIEKINIESGCNLTNLSLLFKYQFL